MTCEIKTLPSGAIRVETYPQLYREILNYVNNDVNKSLSLYGMTMTDEFKNLNIQNPNLEDLLLFIDDYNSFESKDLSKVDRQMFMDLTLSSENVDNVKDEFINAFTVNGVFGVSKQNLINSPLFDEDSTLNILQLSNSTPLQKLYYKLKNNNEEFVNVSTPFNISDGTDFGKVNPDQFLTSVYQNYTGLKTKDEILSKANEIGDEIVLSNPFIITSILQAVQNKQSLISYETDSDFSNVVRKEINSTKTTLENTLDPNQNFTPIISQIEFLLNADLEQFAYDLNDLQIYTKNIENQAYALGFDIGNLSEVIADRNFLEIQDYLSATYSLLTDVNNKSADSLVESFDNFINTHDFFYRKTPQYLNKTVETIDGDGIYLSLESNLSEQELFENASVIKVDNNIFQKITNNKTQTELNSIIFESSILPQEAYSVRPNENNKDIILEDIDSYITEKSKEALTPNSDIGIIKKITSYKILLGINTEATEVKPDNSYLQTDWIKPDKFVIDFNKYLLKNPKLKEIFYFSNRGLESKQEFNSDNWFILLA